MRYINRPSLETLPADKYIVRETRQSKFDPDATITIDVALICPRCKNHLPLLEHGEYAQCEKCHLYLQLFGNGLVVW